MDDNEGYEGVTVAGIMLVRLDGEPTMFLAQRSMDETDDPGVQETYEFPGGHLMEGEDPQMAAAREFEEEIGFPLPEIRVTHGWRAGDDGHYQGFVAEALDFPAEDAFSPTTEVQAVGWFTVEEAQGLNLRPAVAELDLAALVETVVSRNEEDTMAAGAQVEAADGIESMDEGGEAVEEPDFSTDALPVEPIKVHGVLAPEGAPSGDARGFLEGAMTRRAPLRLPFMWQKAQQSGHDGSVVIGSMDRLMRRDGLIHWEGELLPGNEDAEDFVSLLAHFGRFGVSVDGDKGSLDEQASKRDNMAWFDAVRAAGLTACSIPAFEEAYVALGPHPDMPEEDSEDGSVMVAGADPQKFRRGPGWVTNPDDTKRIHSYWTTPGQPGFIKIGWGTSGDFTRCTMLVGEKIAENSPDKLRFIKRICAQWHHDALGYWPGDLDMPGNKTTAEARAERKAKAAAEGNEDIEMDEEGTGWEAVLVSSAGTRALPPASYFERHPDSDATVIEDPDENGIRRTYGYAGEWGVCHIGYDGRCVEVPEDRNGNDFAEFHLGRTKVGEGEYLKTGLITYKTEHRDAQTILSESAQQAHYDNIANAWAAVRLGQDERGVWFSGVVLPHVPDEDCVLIEAAGQVSGEWKYGALRGLQSVNIPGFPVMRSSAAYDDEGNVVALVASMAGGECEPSPAEKMAVFAKIDAEVRFQKLRDQYEKGGV